MNIMDYVREDFKNFCEKKFPGKIINTQAYGYLQVQAGKKYKNKIHYEYINKTVQLHCESDELCELKDFIKNNHITIPANIYESAWQNNRVRWILDKEIKNLDDLHDGIVEISDFFEPVIKNFEHRLDSGIFPVCSFLNEELTIASYQRPYMWNSENVLQLLNDVLESKINRKKEYRIGSLILYENWDYEKNVKSACEIIDGQQRITTILLILNLLNRKEYPILKTLKYFHNQSYKHLNENYETISSWIENKLNTANSCQEFADYLENNCYFVRVIVRDLSEAFQMFDSQNGRGKELLHYNLLKAYHMRAIDITSGTQNDINQVKIQFDKNWEASTNYGKTGTDVLNQLFNEQLYRTRIWSKKIPANEFTKKKIKEFKGYTVKYDSNGNLGKADYAYENEFLIRYFIYKNCKEKKLESINENCAKRNSEEIFKSFFQVNQFIINGEIFFDYIQNYVEIYARLFIDDNIDELADFKQFYSDYCLYARHERAGDTYLRELYKSLIFVFYDRFGDALESYPSVYKALYAYVYSFRVKSQKVFYETVMKLPFIEENGFTPFELILNARNPEDVLEIETYINLKKSELAKNSKRTEEDKGDRTKLNIEKIDEFFTEDSYGKRYCKD